MPEKEKEEKTETEEKTEEETKEKKERYSLEEIPTQTAMVIRDNEKDLVYSGEGIWLEILNKLEKIEKAVA